MKKFNQGKSILVMLLLSVFCIMLINYSSASGSTNTPVSKPEVIGEELPIVGTLDNFKRIINYAKVYNNVYGGIRENNMIAGAKKAEATQDTAQPAAPAAGSTDYSKTNVQVEGVDEADVVKTDGKYIYQVNNRNIVILNAYPASDMKIAGTVEFPDSNFYPSEVYVDGNYLIVIGSSSRNIRYDAPESKKKAEQMMPPYHPYPNSETVKVIVYDITDKENIKELRQAEIEGNYVSSRKIGTKVYLVSNKYVDYYILENGTENVTPAYRDSKVSEEFKNIGYEEIRYFPDTLCSSYMMIGALDISDGKPLDIQTYLGAGQNIYVSNENLYAAVTRYDIDYTQEINPQVDGIAPAIRYPSHSQNTLIYKFALNNGSVSYSAKGEVPGTILNQFSMDEYNNHFRIATTAGQAWSSSADPAKNNIFVLDGSMTVTGKIEDIAPGERIYSVRFMGERGYLVTFETVDPLFAVDLKDPENPKILGALKIPGYSNYLQPYDENHIIGFGKDALVLPTKDRNGNVVGEQAYYMGMKIAIFDVTDVNNPQEKYSIKIGDRGTDSPVLYDHKALLFSKEKNLLAFPVNLFELKDGQSPINSSYNQPEYGTFTYQGAYVYDIDLQKGFTLKGRITHMSNEDYLKSGKYYPGGNSSIERILYINNTLYTLSRDNIKASYMDSLATIKEVTIPQKQ